ncbi:aminoglycoside phosphotransferase family protein [Nonomuraea turkmeniaca]|uniref:Aminoglycoside phosphotransferase family protein n=1 Tax=Nonomuraea turkmeniaca TaxID=103838 RepID=A0A5S4FUK6_9ACTN|nr:phosphotransferase [Nonomuraea turkmeniaca]TMR24292.1 aminoglycoside phosphotransferase family protein [Nonomuraea turkmeniaca]
MQTGPLLGSGRTADVFVIDDAWVLRRYRDGRDAATEATVMLHLSSQGYPVPRVGSVVGGDLIMERLSGPTMVEALQQGMLTPEEAGAILAGLLRRLHALPPRVSTDPANRVLHLDLHPENVMLTPEGPMVIDWANAKEGPPALDWGMSALILAEVAVDPRAEAPLARTILVSLLGDVDHAIDLGTALAIRAANPTLSQAEKQLLDEAVALVSSLLHTIGNVVDRRG